MFASDVAHNSDAAEVSEKELDNCIAAAFLSVEQQVRVRRRMYYLS